MSTMMMLQPDLMVKRLERMRAMTHDQIVALLVRRLKVTVNMIVDMALAVQVLEERGVPIDILRKRVPLLPELQRVSSNELLPDLMVRCMNAREHLQAIGLLPVVKQRAFLEGERVPVVVPGPDGTLTHDMKDPFKLPREMLTQVFDEGRVRSEEQQRNHIQTQQLEAAKPLPDVVGNFRLDRELKTATMIVGKTAALEELERVVAVLKGRRPE